MIWLLTGCNKKEEESQTDVLSAIYTEAISTLNAGNTQTASISTPTFTATETLSPSPTQTSTQISVPVVTSTIVYSGAANISTCDIAGFVADVTIPDGAEISAGQNFTKTWKIKNEGTCTWNSNYKIEYYSGERLNTNISYALTSTSVAPGELLEISIQMTAPAAQGDYISNWILKNATGQYFGIGQSGGVLYVLFTVSGNLVTTSPTGALQPSATVTPTGTDTPEPSETSTTSD